MADGCRAAEQQTRCHNGSRHSLAGGLKRTAMIADQKVPVPGWTRRDGNKFVDAVLDVETFVPGSTSALRIDIEVVRTEAKSNANRDVNALLCEEEQKKITRWQ